MWSFDREGTITLCEGKGLDGLGLRPGENVGQSVRELYRRRPDIIDNIEHALTGETFSAFVQIRGLTFQVIYLPERDSNGQVVAVNGIALNATRLAPAEPSFADTCRHLERVADIPLLLWSIDRRGILSLAKGPGFAALGVAAADLVGRSVYEEFPDFPEALRFCERALRGETLFQQVAGRGRVFENRYFPDRDTHGEIRGVNGLSFDVTERVRAEQEAERSRGLLEEAQRLAHVGSWEVDLKRGETRWSEETYRIFGVEPGSIAPSRAYVLQRVHSEDLDRFEAALRQLESGIHSELTYRVIRADGAVVIVHTRGKAELDAAGRPARVFGTVQDVTQRETVREEAKRAKASLAEAQRVAHIGSWEWRAEGDRSEWSEEIFRVFGLDPSTRITRELFASCIHPDDRERVFAVADASLEGGVPYPKTIYRVLHPSAVRIVEQHAEVVRDQSGRALGMIGTVQDVTEREQVAERLSTLTSALEQTADAVFITDRDGVIAYVNEAFVRQSQYTREEVMGATPRLLNSGAHPPEFFGDLWRRILAGEAWRGAFVNRRKDGSIYHEEKTITPVQDEAGRVTHFVSTGRDITARRKAEETQMRLQEAVARSAYEWRATFDAVDSLIVVLDSDGRVLRPNRAARDVARKSYQEIMGTPVGAVGPEPLWEALADAARRVTSTGEPVSLQAFDDKSGRTWDVGANPLTGPEITDGAVIVLARDVSALVKLQESLRRSETTSAMGRLVAGVAHEVRNPLFAISATVDAFGEESLDRPEFRQYGVLLKNEVERLTGLMQDLLDYGRPSPVRLEPGPIVTVFERAMRLCQPQATGAGVMVVCDPPGRLPLVPMDCGRLVQVFQNLLGNAIEHAPRGSEVLLAAALSADGTGIECRVEDCGPGFRQEDLPRVFEPFFTRRRGGTGLGLSIVERLVAAHGGGVDVANRSEGGALVTVRLPLGGVS